MSCRDIIAAATQDAFAGRTLGRTGRVVRRTDRVVIGIGPVGAPLPHVAMHVVKTPGVRPVGADFHGSSLLRFDGGVAAAMRLRGGKLLADAKCRLRAGAA